MYPYYCYLPSYLTLLELHYGDCIKRSQVAQERAGEVGISVWESERWVDLELFLDEYPKWGLGTPHWLVVLHEMFLHAMEWGQKEAERGKMHVPLRLPGQHIWTWSWGRPICHGTGRLPNVLEGDEGHLPQCIPFKKVPRVPLLQRMTKEKSHSGYTLLPDGSTAKAGISCHNQRSGPQGGEGVRLDWQGS